jgi:adenylate cyclase
MMASDGFERRLVAIFSADVVGYSRLMAADDLDTIRRITAYRRLIRASVEQHGGRVVDDPGDNVLAELPTASAAVGCALEIQRESAARNSGIPADRRMDLRIGISLGEVMEDSGRIYGTGVNLAARLEALSDPGGVCISEVVYSAIRSQFDVPFRDLGPRSLKNIPEPVRAFSWGASVRERPRSSRRLIPLPASAHDQRSLAVLPFVNMSGDAGQDYFADGLTMDLQTALVKISGIHLVGEPSTFATRSEPLTIGQLSSELGVNFLLEGGVRRDGNQVRISAQLMDARTGQRIWAERFDRVLDDHFAVQDEITEEIVTALDVKLLSGESARVFRKSFRNPRALEAYYRGWQRLFGTTRSEIQQAQRHFEEAIQHENDSPLGYALAAWAWWWEAFRSLTPTPEVSLARAEDLANRAIELEDSSGLAHLMLAHVHLMRRDYDVALGVVGVALCDRPSCEGAFAAKAHILNYMGRSDEAADLARRAIEFTPVYPPLYPAILAHAYATSGRYEDAIEAAQIIIEHHPETLDAHLILIGSCAALDRHQEAQASVEAVRSYYPGFRVDTFAATQPYMDPSHLELVTKYLKSAGLE